MPPVEKLFPLQEVALVELHESKDEPPEVIVLGVAVRDAVGVAANAVPQKRKKDTASAVTNAKADEMIFRLRVMAFF